LLEVTGPHASLNEIQEQRGHGKSVLDHAQRLRQRPTVPAARIDVAR